MWWWSTAGKGILTEAGNKYLLGRLAVLWKSEEAEIRQQGASVSESSNMQRSLWFFRNKLPKKDLPSIIMVTRNRNNLEDIRQL